MLSGTAPFEALYDIDAVLAVRHHRGPNILISILVFGSGGAEVFPIRLANELKWKGHAITFHSLEYLAQDCRVRAMLRSDIPVVRCSSPAAFLEILDSFGIEVVNTHHHGTQELFRQAIRQARADSPINHVATSHGVYEVLSTDYLDNTLSEIDACVDLWTCVADKNMEPFRERSLYTPDRFVRIGNGMEPPELRSADREALGIAKDAFVLCIATRAILEKGWREAIDAVSVAREHSRRDIQLLLIGNGPLYDELAGEQLPTHTHLLGFREDPLNYYACSDMGLLPSYYKAESFPLTVVEALFAGRPVIASDIGEIRNMLQEDGETAGALFDLVDNAVPVSLLADIIVSFATEEERYQSAVAIASRLCGRLDISDVGDQYLAVFHKVLGEIAPIVPQGSVWS